MGCSSDGSVYRKLIWRITGMELSIFSIFYLHNFYSFVAAYVLKFELISEIELNFLT